MDKLAPRPVDRPAPGYFRLKLVKGGPWVAAIISKYEDERINGWWAAIDGKWSAIYPSLSDGNCPGDAPEVWRIWHGGHPISAVDYALLLATKVWAEREMPEHPAANPGKKIDISRQDPIF